MKLTSIKFLNFRKFRQQEIEFNDKFSIIFWKNGAWKSTIVDAIGFALFRSSWNEFTRWSLDTLKSYTADEKEWSKIELNFEVWLEKYKVVRILHKWYKTHSSDFIEETKDTLLFWSDVIYDPKPITDYIESLLGIDKNTFLRSVLAKQKDVSVLSGVSSDKRKDLITKVLWINRIEFLASEFEKKYRVKKRWLEEVKSFISEFNEKEIKVIIKELEVNIKEKNKEIKALEKQIEDKKKQGSKIETEYKRLEELKISYDKNNKELDLFQLDAKKSFENLDKIIKEIVLLNEKWKKLEENKWDFTVFEKLEKEYSEIQATFEKFKLKKNKEESLEKQKEYLQKIKSSITEVLKTWGIQNVEKLNENLQKTDENIKKSEENLTKQKSIVTEMLVKLQNITKDGKDLAEELNNLKELAWAWECPTCKRELWDHAPKIIAMTEENIKKKREEYTENKKSYDKLELKEKELTSLCEKEKLIKEKLLNLKISLQKLISDEENSNKNIEVLNDELKEIWDVNFNEEMALETKEKYLKLKVKIDELKIIKSEILRLPELSDSESKIKEYISSLESRIKAIELTISELKYKEEDFIIAKNEYLNYQNEINKMLEWINNLTKEKAFLDNTLIREKTRLEEFLSKKKRLEEEKNILNDLFLKKDILREYANYLLIYLKPIIEELASEYFRIVTNWKYSMIELTNDYLIEIEGKSLDLYSWGEKDLANLCLRLALSQNLSNNKWKNQINFLILDEVLWSQDFERRSNVLASLKQLEDKFSQIILISHIDEIKDIASSLIEVESINKYESTISLK